ncbi:MAG: ABC transporter permease [Hydrogenophaga sp.]|uniref:ABC transporter permease n=1 Tax=Hydrogenophaga sp. TaxID=1904254 RepID=UPI001BC28F00|nr:ABC transporter permease [Hydrogenophaga sp.]MBS3911282.1 ABC transporter permease [Hydrogenophaga sp.]MDO9146169.1 ABC transporter permease [Hydrogenophaga sp.]MDO9605074.1 ABC transporter permease [Hydrogenophaga sp.]MDP2162698.1 ABC transporter permease [Hydrogenophaga sp.]MDP3477010.1 ABC transporter permease [Hydrogenophaga sp.]
MSSSIGAGAVLPAPTRDTARANPAHRRAGWRPLQGLWAWPFPLAVLLLWHLSSVWGWAPEQVLPPPAQVFRTFADLAASGELWDNLHISLVRVFTGFGIGLLVGLSLGVAMGLSPTVRAYLFPLFKAFSQVPVIGWLPLLMLLVGIDEALKFLLIAKATLVPVTLNTCHGIQGVPNRFIEVARVYGFTRWQMLTRVVFPAATAPIWNGVRYGLTHAWLALVVVELLASSEGIGFLIVYGRQLFQLDVVLAAVLAVGIVGFVIDKLLSLSEAWLLRWRKPGL